MRCIAAVLTSLPMVINAQSTVAGKVVTDSARLPVAGAEVRAVRPGVVATTDSAGRFNLRNLPPGPVAIVTRALGFAPDSTIIDLGPDETLSSEIRLKRRISTLGEVRVRDSAPSPIPAKLMAFDERRRVATGGHFLDSTVIVKWVNRKTGDLLSMVSGVDVQRVRSAAYVTGSRGPQPLTASASSRPVPCFMDVYLDGAPLAIAGTAFDVNSIGLNHLVAIEVYTGPSNTPAQYNRTSKACGVVLLWTK